MRPLLNILRAWGLLTLIVLPLSSCGDGGQPNNGSTLIGLSGVTATYDTSESAYRELLDASKEAGVTLLHVQLANWRDTEVAPGVYDFTEAEVFLDLLDQYNVRITLDVATPLGLDQLDLPPDLEFVSFRDEELIRRYKNYLEAVIAKFGKVSHITLHTETAVSYFEGQPESFNDFCELLSIAIDHIHSLSPGTKVGVYGNADESAASLTAMNRSTDFFGISYLAPRGDSDHAATLQRLVNLAGDKPLALIEVGVPTSATQGGSEIKQVEFVNFIFDFAAQLGSRLEYLSYYQVFDEDIAITSLYVPQLFPNFSPEMQRDLIDFLTSLGLHRSDKTPKPAWEVFKIQAQE